MSRVKMVKDYGRANRIVYTENFRVTHGGRSFSDLMRTRGTVPVWIKDQYQKDCNLKLTYFDYMRRLQTDLRYRIGTLFTLNELEDGKRLEEDLLDRPGTPKNVLKVNFLHYHLRQDIQN